MKTELNQKDKENIEKARHLLEAASELSNDAAILIRTAINVVMDNLAKEQKWEEMEKLALSLPDSVEKFYAVQYAYKIKEEAQKSFSKILLTLPLNNV